MKKYYIEQEDENIDYVSKVEETCFGEKITLFRSKASHWVVDCRGEKLCQIKRIDNNFNYKIKINDQKLNVDINQLEQLYLTLKAYIENNNSVEFTPYIVIENKQ